VWERGRACWRNVGGIKSGAILKTRTVVIGGCLSGRTKHYWERPVNQHEAGSNLCSDWRSHEGEYRGTDCDSNTRLDGA
jgi:hypothetical protein